MNEIFYNKQPTANNNNGIDEGKSMKTGKRGMVNVCGIILGGNGPLKSQLFQSPFLKHYISSSIIKIIDTNYGGKCGFYEVIRKSANLLKQNELEGENKLIEDTFDLIANDNDNENGNVVSIGFDETLYAINLNIVKYIILSSGYYKYAVKLMGYNDDNDEYKENNNIKVMKQIKFAKHDIELNQISKSMLNDNNDKNNSIEIVTFIKFFDKLCIENNIELKLVGLHSPITQQFAKGLSGCIGVLHYAINLQNDQNDEEWLSDQ